MNKKNLKRILITLFAREYIIVLRNGSFDTSAVFHVWPWESFKEKLQETVKDSRLLGTYTVITRL